jgi:cellulose synthase/poly-beta-1,6-N-acetylglucosamine synthase-like glycosyltransferase
VFLLYPALLKILSTVFKKEVRVSGDYFPSIDLVVAAYNEEKLIEGAIHSIYEDTYPPHLLKVWVANDGSGDRTAEILASLQKDFPSLHVLNLPRTGKNGALNEVFKKLTGDVTVFMDADCLIIKGGLQQLVSPFYDREVGAVIGRMSFDRNNNNAGTQGESFYQRLEHIMRSEESSISSIVSSLGAFYAVRKEYIRPLPNNNVCDDYLPLLRVAKLNKRIIYAPQAKVTEIREKDTSYEFGRIVRFTSGGLASLRETKSLLLPHYGWVSFFLWSHKILRWISPFFLLALFIASGIGAFKSSWIAFLFAVQVVFYSMAFFGWLMEKRNGGNSFLKLSYFFFIMNLSMMVGVYRFFKNTSTAQWETSSR